MLFLIAVVVVLLVTGGRKRAKKEARLLFDRGQLVGRYAVFPCGCRFDWTNHDAHPRLCVAHQEIIAAEIEA